MAYRVPRVSYVHAVRDVGAGEITVSDAAHEDFPVDNLIDDRNGTRFSWSGDVTDPTIDIDLGEVFVTGLSRLIIPANHNIQTVTVLQDSDVAFGSTETLHASDSGPTPGTLYDSGAFDQKVSDERYIRILITGTAQFYLSQLVLTKVIFGEATSVGPDLADALDGFKTNSLTLEQASGQRPSVQNGPDQRVIRYPYPSPFSGADLTAMEAFVAAVGTHHPFFVDPASFSTPPETDEPALWMKFLDMPEVRNSVLVPHTQARSKTYSLDLIESLD